MTDLTHKTFEELCRFGDDYWHLMLAFNELHRRLNAQHEEIERLKKEASEWKAFYFETMEKLTDTREGRLNALRESGEPK